MGQHLLKSELVTCMGCFKRHFEQYVMWYQLSDEPIQEDHPMETPMSLRESEALELRTWVETCVDELAMDANTTECT